MAARAQAMAAAEKGAEVKVTVPYAEILALPTPQLEATLAQGEYSDVQALCKHAGLSAKGTRSELERRIIEHATEQLEAAPSAKSPERRAGRARSPKHGAAAAAVRTAVQDDEIAAAQAAKEDELIRDRAARASLTRPRGLAPGAPPAAVSGPSRPVGPGVAVPPPSTLPKGMDIDSGTGSYYGTPLGKTQRSEGVHSGFTPQLHEKRLTLEEFLAGSESKLESLPVPPPLPGNAPVDPALQALLDGQAALIKGVNELRANVVTRDALAKFYELQSQEMQTFVLAETAPLHSGLSRVASDVTLLSQTAVKDTNRIDALEARVNSGTGGYARDKFDPAYQRVSFTQFPENILQSEKIRHIEEFMAKNFQDLRYAYIDSHSPKTFFVHFGTPKNAKKVLDAVKQKSLKFGMPGVKILPALTSIDVSRNWALREAKEIIEKDARSRGKSVDVRKAKGRGLYIDEEAVFLQKHRYEPRGQFEGKYADLKLS